MKLTTTNLPVLGLSAGEIWKVTYSLKNKSARFEVINQTADTPQRDFCLDYTEPMTLTQFREQCAELLSKRWVSGVIKLIEL